MNKAATFVLLASVWVCAPAATVSISTLDDYVLVPGERIRVTWELEGEGRPWWSLGTREGTLTGPFIQVRESGRQRLVLGLSSPSTARLHLDDIRIPGWSGINPLWDGNGSFEEGLSGWSVGGDGGVVTVEPIGGGQHEAVLSTIPLPPAGLLLLTGLLVIGAQRNDA